MIIPVYQRILDSNVTSPSWTYKEFIVHAFHISLISALLETIKFQVPFLEGGGGIRATLDELFVFSNKDNSFNMKRKISFIYTVFKKKKTAINKQVIYL